MSLKIPFQWHDNLQDSSFNFVPDAQAISIQLDDKYVTNKKIYRRIVID